MQPLRRLMLLRPSVTFALALVITGLPGLATRTLADTVELDTGIEAGLSAEEMEADCLEQLTDGTAEEIVCAFPAVMSRDDRKSIRDLTRQIFRDARCMVSVKIARSVIDEALANPDSSLKAPPQNVKCEVITTKGRLPVEFTFAPVVEFQGGRAVTATPGMDNVTGVNSWLAWPVVAYVNSSSTIESIMLRVVNAYVERHGGTQAAAVSD